MDIGKLVGKTFMSFTGQDGRPVELYKYHCVLSAPDNDPYFEGEQVSSFSVLRSRYDIWLKAGAYIPDIGDEFVVRYSRSGKLDFFERLPE